MFYLKKLLEIIVMRNNDFIFLIEKYFHLKPIYKKNEMINRIMISSLKISSVKKSSQDIKRNN